MLAATNDDDLFGGFFESDTWAVARNLGSSSSSCSGWRRPSGSTRTPAAASRTRGSSRWPVCSGSCRPSSGRSSTSSSARPSTSRTFASVSSRSARWRTGWRESELRCPVCRGQVEPTFLVCPICTTRLKQACTRLRGAARGDLAGLPSLRHARAAGGRARRSREPAPAPTSLTTDSVRAVLDRLD